MIYALEKKKDLCCGSTYLPSRPKYRLEKNVCTFQWTLDHSTQACCLVLSKYISSCSISISPVQIIFLLKESAYIENFYLAVVTSAVLSLTDKILFWEWQSLKSTLGEVQYIVDRAIRGCKEKRNKA